MTAQVIAIAVLLGALVAAELDARRTRARLAGLRAELAAAVTALESTVADLRAEASEGPAPTDRVVPISAATREAIAVAIHTPRVSDVHDALDRVARDSRYDPHS
jgi:hypothetical protein